jgi:hypothetical protein
MTPVAILNVRNSLSLAFLVISDNIAERRFHDEAEEDL